MADSGLYLDIYLWGLPFLFFYNIATGILFLRVLSPFYFVVSAKLVADGVLRGAGMMKKFMAATSVDLILRVVLAIALSGKLGSVGIWCAWPVGWSISTVLSVCFYGRGPWMEKKSK